MSDINLSEKIKTGETFIDEIYKRTGQNITKCNQCGKCTGGCPTVFAMDQTPRKIMRMIQFGMKEEVLSTSAIWLCTNCSACTARCPRGLDIVKIMNVLRIIAREEDYTIKERTVPIYNNIFLDNIRVFGRAFQFGQIMRYNMAVMKPFKDIDKILVFLGHGKMRISPNSIKDKRRTLRIFWRSTDDGGGEE